MRRSVLVLFFILPFLMHAQKDSGRYVHKSMFRAQLTISPGYMLKEKIATIYLHGNFEYYLDKNISLRGDGFYFINSNYKSPGFPDFTYHLIYNHSVFAGADFHFNTSNHFDPYLGIGQGVSISQTGYFSDPEF